jgi:hypothetical protein
MGSTYWLQAAPVDHVDSNEVKKHDWIKKDNPYVYDELQTNYVNPTPKRHVLGLVGGNQVGLKEWGAMIDIESDLRGTTRPLTDCPAREFMPIKIGQKTIVLKNRKTNMTVDISQPKLPEYQMWAYAPVYAPEPMVIDRCGKPEKY